VVSRLFRVAASCTLGVFAGAGALECFGEGLGGEVAGGVVQGDGAEQELGIADLELAKSALDVAGTRR
jgi:hypothetical protein